MLCGAAVVVGKELKRCTFPHPARRTTKPRHTRLGAGKTRTAPACSQLILPAAFGHAFDVLISLVFQTTYPFNFHCLAQLSLMPTDRPIDLEPELQARERKAKKGDMAVSGRPTDAFATARLLNARGWPHLSHHTQFACYVWPPSKRGTSRILNDERAGGVQGSF